MANIIVNMKIIVTTETFNNKNPKLKIINNHLHNFLPKIITQTIQLNLPNNQITLNQLLTQTPLKKNGNLIN